MKKFRVQIYAYQLRTDFIIESLDGPIDIENAIIDKLGKNDINAIVSMGMIPQGYRVNNYLTDTDAFYIITVVPNGMKMFTRAPLTTAMEGDFDTGNVRYKARERYSFGVSDPRGIFGVEGA